MDRHSRERHRGQVLRHRRPLPPERKPRAGDDLDAVVDGHPVSIEPGAGFRLERIDHVQLAMPVGAEAEAVAYFVEVLGMVQVPKPPSLAARGGAWFEAGAVTLHVGAEADFRPARKAHPAIVVDDLAALAARLLTGGYEVRWDEEIPDVRRFHTDDPFGNRIEWIAATAG